MTSNDSAGPPHAGARGTTPAVIPDTVPESMPDTAREEQLAVDGARAGWSVYREEADSDPYGDRGYRDAGMYAPGDISPETALYVMVDSAGLESQSERTVRRGEPFPPTDEAGQFYRRVWTFPNRPDSQ